MARDWFSASGDWNSNTESWEGEAEFPAKADLSLTGSVPTRSAGQSAVPASASATFVTTYPWDLVSGTWADASGTWAAPAVNVPAVAVGTIITITKGAVTLSTSAPKFGIDYKFSPAKTDLKSNIAQTTWANFGGDWDSASGYWEQGYDPAVAVGTAKVPAVATMEITKSYEWNSYTGNWSTGTSSWNDPPNTYATPTVTIGENVYPGVNTLTITGFGPDVDIMRLTYVPSASMTTTLHVPYAFRDSFAIVPTGALNLNPDKVVWNNWVGDWDSATEAWDEIIDTRPSVAQTFSFDPTTGELVLAGQDPDIQHRAPKFLPSVQVI